MNGVLRNGVGPGVYCGPAVTRVCSSPDLSKHVYDFHAGEILGDFDALRQDVGCKDVVATADGDYIKSVAHVVGLYGRVQGLVSPGFCAWRSVRTAICSVW